MRFAGEFEIHVTVTVFTPAELEALADWARVAELKFLHIVLDRGTSVSQPMLSWRTAGDLPSAASEARGVADRLSQAGFAVTRVKLEANPENDDVPRSDEEARTHPDRYFEHHVKLRLDGANDFEEARRVALRHAAHLSRNARSTSPDGSEYRFATQRCHSVGQATADARLRRMIDDLVAANLRVVAVEREWVVYDSNEGLDEGWILSPEER